MPNCLIVDDEPLSRDVLRKYIQLVPDMQIEGECPDAMEAMEVLNQKKIDILFLDIQMPGLSGISFARSLTAAPLLIFSTAYPEYAVEGFELQALDYLVKPFSFERFLKAVNRAREKLESEGEQEGSPRKIVLRADKKIYAVTLSEILLIEGRGDYIRICFQEKNLVVHDTIKNFLEKLPPEDFMRIHKSYVVNLRKIDFIEGNRVRMGARSIPVGQHFKDELLERYGR